MTKRVIIVGIPGVGKSTVITNTFDLLRRKGLDIKIAEFGKIMFEQASKFSINNRDELRKLSIEKQQFLQEMTANSIFSYNHDIVIIDTHLFISTENGYYPGIPIKLLKILNPTHLILISAEAKEILERRKTDTTRQRDMISEEKILNELKLAEIMIASSSIFVGCPFAIIENNDNKIIQVAEEICRIISIS